MLISALVIRKQMNNDFIYFYEYISHYPKYHVAHVFQ